jgi:hypothetical protein
VGRVLGRGDEEERSGAPDENDVQTRTANA